MSDDLHERLAHRRRRLRRRQVRRRRRIAVVIALLLLVAAGLLLLGQRDGTPDRQPAPEPTAAPVPKSGSPETARSPVPPAGPDWKRSRGPVPILMYHVIGEPAGEVSYPDLYLSVADFRAQVDWLKENGYTAVTLDRVQDAWYRGATLPQRPVVLSFDDGYLGQYLDAAPILRRAGWPGLLNLKAEGSDLSVKQVRRMVAAGWEIGSHTTSHPDLRGLAGAELTAEVAGSKRLLERKLGVPVRNFCYPAGRYDERTIAAVKAAGYRGATTVNPGPARRSMPFELNRIRIDRGDGPGQLATKLSGAA